MREAPRDDEDWFGVPLVRRVHTEEGFERCVRSDRAWPTRAVIDDRRGRAPPPQWPLPRRKGRPGGRPRPGCGAAPTVLGREHRRRWACTLACGSTRVEQILQWGLLGPDESFTAGAALNSALLYGAGGRALVLDEDIAHRAVARPVPGDAGPPGDPTSLEVVLPQPRGGPVELAFSAAWELPLGRALMEAGLSSDAPVRCLGLAGDGGMRSACTYLLRGGAWLAARAPHWPQIACSRTVVRAAPAAARGSHLMSAALSLDLRTFVPPPLFPVLRNTDGLWGRHLASLGQPPLHLPYAALHAPKPEATTSRVQALHDLVRPRATDLLSLVPVPEWPEINARGATGWPAALLGPWRAHCERVAERLDDARRLAPPPARAPELHEDLAAAFAGLAAAARHVPPPDDLPSRDPWQVLSELVARYLDLLEVWPEVWLRSRER